MSDTERAYEQSGRLRLKGALVGGVLAALGAILAWAVVGKLIH